MMQFAEDSGHNFFTTLLPRWRLGLIASKCKPFWLLKAG
jgi:hypothetical protein